MKTGRLNSTDLTFVIIGALFDRRSAPPPAPPAAPAHWSTSIRSIPRSTGPAVAATNAGLRPPEGGVGLYSSPLEARPAGLTSSKPEAAKSAGRTPKGPGLYRIPPAKTPCPRPTVIYEPQRRLESKFNGCVGKKKKNRIPRGDTRGKVSNAHLVQTRPARPDSAAELLIR